MARPANRKTGDSTVTTAAGKSATTQQPAAVTNEEIARHAYALYLARGAEHGHDVEDWLQAERELHGDPEC